MGARTPLLHQLTAGTAPPIGTWVKLPSLETVEMLAHAGFDFVVVDLEHSPLTLETAYDAVVLAQALGMSALVRVPDRSGSHFQRVLDLGADGVLVPQIAGAEQARQLMSQLVFPPEGVRGMGITSRAGGWGRTPVAEYVRRGQQDVLRAVQFESVGSLEAAADILDAPGLNAAFLGAADLSMSTGLPAGHPQLQSLVDHLLEQAQARAVPVGTAVASAADVRAAVDRGFAYVMVGNDAGIFGRAVADVRAAVASALL
jgi:2-keto-3-deoxy-L-rhamnonate aldolase RhmA